MSPWGIGEKILENPRGYPAGPKATQRGSRAVPEPVSSSSGPRRLGPDVTCSMICRRWCLKVAVFSSSYSQPRASAAWFAHSNRMNCFRPTAQGTEQKHGGEVLGMQWVDLHEDPGDSHRPPASGHSSSTGSLRNCPAWAPSRCPRQGSCSPRGMFILFL